MTKHEVYDGYHQVETIVDCLTQKAIEHTIANGGRINFPKNCFGYISASIMNDEDNLPALFIETNNNKLLSPGQIDVFTLLELYSTMCAE